MYPAVGVESGDVPAVGLAGARLLTEAVRVTGLGGVSSAVPCLRGGGRGRCTTRAGSWRIWRCAWLWEAVACRTWPSCGARTRSLGRWPPMRRCHDLSGLWPGTSRRSRPSRPGPQDGETAGAGPGRRALTDCRCLGGPAAGDRHRRHRRRRPLRERPEKGGCGPDLQKGVRLPPTCPHGSTTAPATGGVSARRWCCVRVTRDRTPSPTTSRSSAGWWTRPGSAPEPVGGCWCAPGGAGGTKETIEFLTRRRVPCSVGVHAARLSRRGSTGTIPETA